MKMVEEHPLITYIEDPLASADLESLRSLRQNLQDKAPVVQLGLKSQFTADNAEVMLEKVKEVTGFEHESEE